MKSFSAAAALALLFTTSAFAQSVPEKTGINSTLGIAPKTVDFVKEAAISDMFEITFSKMAEDKGDADSKSFDSRMVKDHTETSTELKALASSGKVKATVPTALDSAHQSKLDKLKSLNSADFNKLRFRSGGRA